MFNFNGEKLKESLIGIAILVGVIFIFSIDLIWKVLVTLLLAAAMLFICYWTISSLWNANYNVIKRIIKFFLRLIVSVSGIYGFILFIPYIWKK